MYTKALDQCLQGFPSHWWTCPWWWKICITRRTLGQLDRASHTLSSYFSSQSVNMIPHLHCTFCPVWHPEVKWKSLSRVRLFATPWTIQSLEFSRPEYWSGWPFSSPGDLPNPGIKPRSPALQVDSLPAELLGKPKNTGLDSLSVLQRIFPTQDWNQGLLRCRRILYQLSYQGSPSTSFLMVYFSDVAVYRGPKCGIIMLSDIPKHKLIVSIWR